MTMDHGAIYGGERLATSPAYAALHACVFEHARMHACRMQLGKTTRAACMRAWCCRSSRWREKAQWVGRTHVWHFAARGAAASRMHHATPLGFVPVKSRPRAGMHMQAGRAHVRVQEACIGQA